ncbi:MAG: hypothetical protein ACKO97_05020 [Actinomycetota bacterium]
MRDADVPPAPELPPEAPPAAPPDDLEIGHDASCFDWVVVSFFAFVIASATFGPYFFTKQARWFGSTVTAATGGIVLVANITQVRASVISFRFIAVMPSFHSQ